MTKPSHDQRAMIASGTDHPPVRTDARGGVSASEPPHPKLPHQIVTSADAHALLEYDDGKLIWRHDTSIRTKCAGKVAGNIRKDGYCALRLKGKAYLAHRVIFLMHHGYWPKSVDHIDGNPRNNRIENLRECTVSQNMCNRKIQKNNTHGAKNIFWHARDKRWVVRVTMNGKTITAGSSKDKEVALAIAHRARNVLHGEFSRAA